jgi:hypothetical protein
MHDTKERLSLFWIFALLNCLYADVIALLDSDWQEDEALVADRPLSSARSRLSHMACEEELCASLRPVSVNNAEAWFQRVLGILTTLKAPTVSWISDQYFLAEFPCSQRGAP